MNPGVGRAALASIVVAALALAGCGGSTKSSGTASTEHRPLTTLDLVNVVGTAPDTPEGAAYVGNPATSLTLPDLRQRAQTGPDKATVRAFEKAGFRRIYQRSFNGAINVADGTAYLFGNSTGAGKGFATLRTTLETPGGVSQRVTPVAAKGVGEEAWAAHVTGDSEGAVFLWRRSSLVVVADMSCDLTCGFDVVQAVRAYAEAIDGRARDVS